MLDFHTGETVATSDFKNLRVLAEMAGKKFQKGIVLYSGSEILPFGDTLYAVPLSALWEL